MSGEYGNFPPTCIEDIMSYPATEMLAGYADYEAGDHPPGSNHSPGYRWGWTNARQDKTREIDQFQPLRFAYIRTMRNVA